MVNKIQEALKMAIEAIEDLCESFMLGADWKGVDIYDNAVDTLKTCKEALAELALEQMAENARELGLDYCKHKSDSACKECYTEKAK